MLTTFILFGVVFVWIGISILDRCNKILKEVHWLQRAQESSDKDLLSMKKILTPLSFMPFAHIANEITRMEEGVAEEFDETSKFWEDTEKKELEDFVATNPPDGQVFSPSDKLQWALRKWSIERHKMNIIAGWKTLFQEVYLNLLSGKITLDAAEKRLKDVNQFRLLLWEREGDAPEVEKIFKAWAARWDAKEWRRRLDHLRSMEKHKQDFGKEIRTL